MFFSLFFFYLYMCVFPLIKLIICFLTCTYLHFRPWPNLCFALCSSSHAHTCTLGLDPILVSVCASSHAHTRTLGLDPTLFCLFVHPHMHTLAPCFLSCSYEHMNRRAFKNVHIGEYKHKSIQPYEHETIQACEYTSI